MLQNLKGKVKALSDKLLTMVSGGREREPSRSPNETRREKKQADRARKIKY